MRRRSASGRAGKGAVELWRIGFTSGLRRWARFGFYNVEFAARRVGRKPWRPSFGAPFFDFFAEEAFDLTVTAFDNVELAKLLWQIPTLGLRDSADIEANDARRTVRISLPPGSQGEHQLTVTVRDRSGLTSIPFVSVPGAIRVYPTVARPVSGMLIDGDVRDFVIDSRRRMIYFRQYDNSRIAFLSVASRSVTQHVVLAGKPLGLDITPGGDSLLVTLEGVRSLFVIDLRSGTPTFSSLPLTTLDPSLNERPGEVRAMAGGKAFISVWESGTPPNRLLEVDLATGGERFRSDAGYQGRAGQALERSHDGSTLVLNGYGGFFQRYSQATDQFTALRVVDQFWRTASVDGRGDRVTVDLQVFDQSLSLERTLKVPGSPVGQTTALAPTGDVVYVVSFVHGIIRVRASDGAILDRTVTGANPQILRVSSDGRLVVYATRASSINAVGWVELP